MAAQPPGVTSQPRIELPIVLRVLSAGAVLFCANAARHLYSLACWPDRSSDPFELRVGVEGDWIGFWEPQSGKNRERVLWLDRPPWTEDSGRLGSDILVTIEPHDAVIEQGSSPVDAHGERLIEWGREGGGLIVIDPPLVRRIHYRVARVDPSFEGSKTQLLVRGSADSEFPELAPVFLQGALWSVLLGLVPGILWFRAIRRKQLTASTT